MKKQIYLVGGAVRDALLGREIKDKDYVAVGYGVDEFSHLRQVGKDFPVFLREDGSELALARVERKIGVGYNGFETDTADVTLHEDLMRRDLSINAIAYDEENGCYIDPFNGRDDIEKKMLRHTSDAFVEDPLRVLRLARFRATFGYEWSIHPSTKVLVYRMREELKHLQGDRVWKEIEKVLMLEDSHLFFETLFELGVLGYVFPSIYNLTTLKEGTKHHHESSLFVHAMMVLRELRNESPLLKLCAIYHDIAKPQCYREYGNGSGHEDKNRVEPLIDIQIPVKIKSRMLFIIDNHGKVSKLQQMRASKIATFFEQFKKDRVLLLELLCFNEGDNLGRITDNPKVPLDKEMILKIFDGIASYSPKNWMSEQEENPKGSTIAQHVHKYNIGVVTEMMNKHILVKSL
ncbi:polynucleotide adenylyltransferase [Sulfuricurvum sp.]|uniref:polynucleotide adenylyltransferase n=1 Tax=Sulfuricurvum sp. TaxID=2025608 RepID=UPI0026335D26|nr:polynucleotide adenylyltransferase [Sulfuricurvum sp.]MDD4949098.1 polynucleotide adenylyltransferase [Sulfuricurvum sp.]